METRDIDSAFFEEIGNDALSLLRIDFVLVGFYLTVFSLLAQALGQQIVIDVLNAAYTQFSLHALFASMAASVLIYRKAKRISVQGEVNGTDTVSEEMLTVNIITASAFASFGSVIFVTLGIIEAIAGEILPLTFPVIAVMFLVVIWILGPFSILTILDKLSQKNKRLRNIVQIFI